MIVYLIRDTLSKEVAGVFSSEQKARDWLDNKAVQEWGWTFGEVRMAEIEPWIVDSE